MASVLSEVDRRSLWARSWALTCERLKADYVVSAGHRHFRLAMLLHPGLQVSFFYRLSRFFHLVKLMPLARLCGVLMRWVTRCDIHHGSDIAGGVQFPHGSGVVVGEGVVIGSGCSLFQHTTVGALEGRDGAPVLEDGVNLYPGTVVAGAVRVGEYCRVGPSVYLTESVLSHTRVAPPAPKMTRKI